MGDPTPFRRRPPPPPPQPSPEEEERLRGAAPPTSAGQMKKARPFEPIHSGPGVGSFLLAVVSAILLATSTLWSMILAVNNVGAANAGAANAADDAAGIGCLFLLAILCVVLGVILGFIGILEQYRKTTFAWIGLLTNGAVIAMLFLFWGYAGL